MTTVRWFWIDGSMDEFTVDKHHAREMVMHLYKNPDIVSVEYEEES